MEINNSKKYLRDLKNSKRLYILSDKESQEEYDYLYRIIAKTSTKEFLALTPEKKYEELEAINNEKNVSPTREEIKLVQREILKDKNRRTAIEGLLTATKAINTTIDLVTGLGGLFICVKGGPPMIRTAGCGLFSSTILSNFNTVGDFIFGNYLRNVNSKKYSTNIILKDFTSNVYDKFLNSDEFEFQSINHHFDFNIETSLSSDLNEIIDDDIDKEFLNLLMRLDSLNIHNEDELNDFLLNYVAKVGEKQKEALENITIHAKREETAIQERDKMALYNSLNGFVSTIINQSMSEDEAILFNGLLNAGTQYLIQGSLGPAGWAAIGLNVATNYISKNSANNFNKVIIKALEQIQVQLELIIENIENVLETQMDILLHLNELYKVAIDTKIILVEGLKEIKSDQNLQNKIFELSQIEDTTDSLEKAINNLEDIIFYKSELNELNEIYTIKNIILSELDNNAFTKFGLTILRGKQLKEIILPTVTNNSNKQIRQAQSLYNFIGLTDSLVKNDFTSEIKITPIVHPQYFHDFTQILVQWLIQGNLTNDSRRTIISDIIDKAVQSKDLISSYASQDIVDSKIRAYKKHMNFLISKIKEDFDVLHYRNFQGSNNPYKMEYSLKSVEENRDTYTLEAPFDFNTNANMVKDFLNNHNDISIVTQCWELGIIKNVKTIEKRIAQIVYINNGVFFYPKVSNDYVKINKVVAKKINLISFDNVYIDFSKQLRISFSLKYSSNITFRNYNKGWGAIPVVIKDLKLDVNWEENWKEEFIESVKAQLGPNFDITETLPGFKHYTPEILMKHLINQWILSKKQEFVSSIIQSVLIPYQDITDSLGIQLLYLSKLNEVITSNNVKTFTNDYVDEVYCTDDLINILNHYVNFRFENNYLYSNSYIRESISVYDKLLEEWEQSTAEQLSLTRFALGDNPFYFLDGENGLSKPLNPKYFVDIMIIFLNKGIQRTIRNCQNKIQEIYLMDSEPFLADTINTLLWYQDVFIDDELIEPVYPIKRMQSASIKESNAITFRDKYGKYHGNYSINTSYINYKNKIFFPWCIFIDIWYDNMDANDFPTEFEKAEMNQVIESIISIVNEKSNSHFLAVSDTKDFQTLIFYSKTEKWLMNELRNNENIFKGRDYYFTVVKDPLWSIFDEFMK